MLGPGRCCLSVKKMNPAASVPGIPELLGTIRAGVALDQFVPVTFPLLLGGLFAQLSKPLQQAGDFFLLAAFSQRQDQVIHGGLVLRIVVQSHLELPDGFVVLTRPQIDFPQHSMGIGQSRLQRDGFPPLMVGSERIGSSPQPPREA